MGINLVDLAILAVLLISGALAFFRGFVHEVLSLVSWIGAGIITYFAFPFLQPEVRKVVAVELLADVATGLGIFLVVLVVLAIASRLLSKQVRDSSLGPLDRSAGLLFGLLRGAILVCIAWLLFTWVSPMEDHPEWLREARALPLVEEGSALILELLPEELRPAPEPPDGQGDGQASGRLQNFQQLLSPPPKDDAPGEESGYKSGARQEMERAIEAVLQGQGTSRERSP